ncbi:MAG TPA: CotH kinase family protein, partial [Verrucomicrobiota bacterium]|nr:CotH kinase family protein [Verrucomicrobiota bacterium]
FKGSFGPTSLKYSVFPDSPVASFDSLVMRADYNNSWVHPESAQRLRGTRIRDAWGKATANDMGMAAPHSRFFHLYLNGLYWGVYEFSEKIDASFAANYFGDKKSDYDAIASKPTQAIDGDLTAFNTMANYIKGNDMSNTNNFLQACRLLDMTNFIDYTLLNFFAANQDWGNDNNWNAVHKRKTNELVRFLVWDLERFIENAGDNRVTNTDCPVGLHNALIKSAEYKLLFADRIHKHLFNNGALTPEQNFARWQKFTNIMQSAIVGESARWGDYRRDVYQYSGGPYYLYTLYDHWIPEVSRIITNYFPARNSNFLSQVVSVGLYPNPSTVSAPFFNQFGGYVRKGFVLKLTNSPSGSVYYTTNGADPRVYGSGAVSPQASVFTANGLVLNSPVVVKARTYASGTWSALVEASFIVERLDSSIKITEIMYNPIGGDVYEFIELKNVSELPVNVGLYSISGEISYNFPPNTILTPGQVIVLASDNNPIAFTNRYPQVSVFGWFKGKLNNAGGIIYIKDSSGQIVGIAEYDDEG